MTMEPRDTIYGMPMSEWISRVPNELPQDAVGLWQIVPAGQLHFGLSGDALDKYVLRNIFALLDAGAVPVTSGKGTEYEWIRREELGNNNEQIAENVIAEWHRIGDDVGKLAGSIWFALPDPKFPRYIKGV